MKLFNLIFYILLFFGFFLPTNSNFYIPLPGFLLQFNELAFLLLPFVNTLCTSKKQVRLKDFKLKKKIVLLLFIILFTEIIIKGLLYNQSIVESFKAVRVGLPLFSSVVLLAQGVRADIRVIWKVLLWAIISSVILSIISIFIMLPIYNDIEASDNIIEVFRGRITNSNAAFGIIGLYLLFKDKDKWYNQGLLVKTASVLSVISLILSFNRTYLAILALEFLYLSFTTLSFKNVFKLISLSVILFGIVIWSYNNIEQVQRQLDRRILSIILGQTNLYESAIENSRTVIYEGIVERVNEGHWIIGLPIDKPIFYWQKPTGAEPMIITDTSLVNILLRYGMIPLILFLWILHYMYRESSSGIVPFTLIIFLIASLNIDSLLRHNSILFLIILIFITHHEKKNS
ncbi:hypothetical protein LB450_13300 [Psychroflexus sp. CAK1W]|uniref:hypothetical protein n=1 Tax=Psychroflexus curvus TaxID=2873595 RepID=UPI001CCD36FE|nr:hypothetical protein [Psychroflexus curvus]MBZ9629079.1 hypothetical protein [Psychroflexus curvus]